MGLIIRLGWLLSNAKAARAAFDWMMAAWVATQIFVGSVNLDRFQRWLWNTPQEQAQTLPENPPGEEVEALFSLFRQYMDTQYEVSALRKQILTLPPSPDEGY